MTTYCEKLGAERIKDIAFTICKREWSHEWWCLPDTDNDCLNFANDVLNYVCNKKVGTLDLRKLHDICCSHIKCGGIACAGSCGSIPMDVINALNAEVKGADSTEASESIGRTIETIVKLKIMELVMSTLKPNPVAQAIRMMYSFMRPLMYVLLLSVFSELLGSVV